MFTLTTAFFCYKGVSRQQLFLRNHLPTSRVNPPIHDVSSPSPHHPSPYSHHHSSNHLICPVSPPPVRVVVVVCPPASPLQFLLGAQGGKHRHQRIVLCMLHTTTFPLGVVWGLVSPLYKSNMSLSQFICTYVYYYLSTSIHVMLHTLQQRQPPLL